MLLLSLVLLFIISSQGQFDTTHLDFIIPDVRLSHNSIFADKRVWENRLFQKNAQQVLDVATFQKWVRSVTIESLGSGITKTAALLILNDNLTNFMVKNKTHLPNGYMFFGPQSLQDFSANTLQDAKEALALFFKTNAFYFSALSGDKNGRIFISSDISSRTFFSKITAATDKSYLRVDADFDNNLFITSFSTYYINADGTKTPVTSTELDATKALIFLINYYSEVLHMVVHTFHYIMASGLDHASDISVAMNAFTNPYLINTAKTYFDIVRLNLPNGTGAMVGGIFRADQISVLRLMRELLVDWGAYHTAQQFLKHFVFASFEDKNLPIQLNFLSEFRKHNDLISSYASDITHFMRSDPRYELNAVDQRLRLFLCATGTRVSTVATVKSWIELMTVTGLLHGQTLSFTRFMTTKVALSTVGSEGDILNLIDLRQWKSAAGTIISVQPGRTIMHTGPFKETAYFDPKLADLIETFSIQAESLKSQYLQILSEDPDYLNRYGWILADFLPDGYDGRQLTITSYI